MCGIHAISLLLLLLWPLFHDMAASLIVSSFQVKLNVLCALKSFAAALPLPVRADLWKLYICFHSESEWKKQKETAHRRNRKKCNYIGKAICRAEAKNEEIIRQSYWAKLFNEYETFCADCSYLNRAEKIAHKMCVYNRTAQPIQTKCALCLHCVDCTNCFICNYTANNWLVWPHNIENK